MAVPAGFGARAPAAASSRTLVGYASSVDGFPLSYLEWLPPGYSPEARYPLAVYLHGMGPSTAPVRGGIGGDSIPPALVAAGRGAGFIVLALNTRSEAGFYFDSARGGPQMQDVLDALAHESALRRIGAIYLVGFSMGSVGAFAITAAHPGLIAGIGVAGPITDLFEESAYAGGLGALAFDMNHRVPRASDPATVAQYVALSPARFAPGSFAGVPIYVVAGGRDRAAPNNFAWWPYAQVNSTFVNASSHVVSGCAEPKAGSETFWSLARAQPGRFSFRYVFEPGAPHTVAQFPPSDLFAFFEHRVGPGFYATGFPPGSIVPLPSPP